MNKISTLNDLSVFCKNEREFLLQVGLLPIETKSPKQSTIDYLTNYSKVLSVRESNNLGFIEIILN